MPTEPSQDEPSKVERRVIEALHQGQAVRIELHGPESANSRKWEEVFRGLAASNGLEFDRVRSCGVKGELSHVGAALTPPRGHGFVALLRWVLWLATITAIATLFALGVHEALHWLGWTH